MIRWMERLSKGQPCLILGDGAQTMDFVFVDDIARANLLAATADVTDELKEQARADAEAALAGPLDVYRAWFLDGKTFIGGDTPSIADMRFAATLEFLRVIDYDFPAWADEYMAAMEAALGDAYSEPAADVRGYIDYVRSPSAA